MTQPGIRRRVGVAVAAAGMALLLPLAVAAHPLGNFTINHYAGLRIAPDRISLDVVIDQAEIPTFQERQRIDRNGDGQVSNDEQAAERAAACPLLAGSLVLTADGVPLSLEMVAAGLSFPAGAGGLPTMRTVCEYEALLAAPITAETTIHFQDRSAIGRLGWREVVIEGDRTTVLTDLPSTSVSGRLVAYPQDLLSLPLDVQAADIRVRPGGAALAPWIAPDATALSGAGSLNAPVGGSTSTTGVPGGVGAEISGLFGTADLTPLVVVLSFLAAAALGAGHALTPGHGKTIMAAYLVGTRGTARHAVGLGLATAISHTLGVLVLAGLIVFAGSALPADRVYPILSLVSAVIVVVIGAWLLAGQMARRLRARPAIRLSPATSMTAVVSGGPVAAPGITEAHENESHGDHGHDHGHDHAHGHVHAPDDAHSHDHEHTHDLPPTLTWRSLFALGLSGGLVPSTNALVILVATVAAGRPAYGVLLVLAFGLGMAAVLVGVGIALVRASGWVRRTTHGRAVGRALELAPIVGAVAVLFLGVYLTQQAISGTPAL